MLFYRILADSLGVYPPVYAGTSADAHSVAKALANRDEVRIELVDVPLDKAAVLYQLNHPADHNSFTLKQTWKLSPRGAMVECGNGE